MYPTRTCAFECSIAGVDRVGVQAPCSGPQTTAAITIVTPSMLRLQVVDKKAVSLAAAGQGAQGPATTWTYSPPARTDDAQVAAQLRALAQAGQAPGGAGQQALDATDHVLLAVAQVGSGVLRSLVGGWPGPLQSFLL